MAEIVVYPDSTGLAHGAATRLVVLAAKSMETRGRFTLALAGGSTPEPLYCQLAGGHAEQIDWARVHLFWGDERCVPPDHRQSNFRMVREALLEKVAIPAGNIHRIPGERGPEEGARAYAEELTGFFENLWPTLDVVLLGMGGDGHTASLFPGAGALDVTDQPVVGVPAEEADGKIARITLTVPAINQAHQVILLVSGADKAPMVHIALEGPPDQVPAQRIDPLAGRLTWLLDQPAASRLEGTQWHWGQ